MYLLIGSSANAQSEDVTLIFQRPWLGAGDYYNARINNGGKEVCLIDSDSDKIVSCSTNVNAGEINIKVSNFRGSDFNYVIDVIKEKTYTLVIYDRNNHLIDIILNKMNLVKNKVEESENFNRMSFKIQVISIEDKK